MSLITEIWECDKCKAWFPEKPTEHGKYYIKDNNQRAFRSCDGELIKKIRTKRAWGVSFEIPKKYQR